MAVNRTIIFVICLFFIIFYFFLLPLPKVIDKYESYMQKKIFLDFIRRENRKIEQYIVELDKKNTEALKYMVNEKADNEVYIKFTNEKEEIKKYSFHGKNIINLIYYIFGISIFSIIIINLISLDEKVAIYSSKKNKSKYYINQN
ncbi:MAG TPA: hypothetical protein PLF21_01645 [Exilispira sp.]|nr:hypothetical protein [Exilispira sp.]